MTTQPLRGLFSAVLTPVLENGAVDYDRLAKHAVSLLERGCDGVSLFGTTGEGPSFTFEERKLGLEKVLEAGVPATKILPATGSSAFPETVALTKHALSKGCNNALVMPPFFFKGLSDDDVFAFFDRLIAAVDDPALRLYLYNFPAVTGVFISPDVIGRLVAAHPDIIAGVKDSSGEWDYVTEILDRFGALSLFTGWEVLVPRLLAAGGAGNISGIANVATEMLRDLFDRAPLNEDDPVLKGMGEMVEAVTSVPVTPALKAIAANDQNAPSWSNLRPPLRKLGSNQEGALISAFGAAKKGAGF